MPLEIHYGTLRYKDEEYIGINALIKSIGMSQGLVNWEVDKAVLRFQKEFQKLQKGEIDDKTFQAVTKTPKLMAEAKEVREKASKAGVANHTMLEAFATGDKDSLDHYKATLPNQFTALDNWLAMNHAEILLSEFQVADRKLLVHGRADVLIRTREGTGVYDLKTKSKVYFEQKLQVAFYKHCELALNMNGDAVGYSPTFASILLLDGTRINEVRVPKTEDYYRVIELYRVLHLLKKELAA